MAEKERQLQHGATVELSLIIITVSIVSLALLFAAVLISARIAKPLVQMAKLVGSGDLSKRLDESGKDEGSPTRKGLQRFSTCR